MAISWRTGIGNFDFNQSVDFGATHWISILCLDHSLDFGKPRFDPFLDLVIVIVLVVENCFYIGHFVLRRCLVGFNGLVVSHGLAMVRTGENACGTLFG